jgi:NADH:ubiquinone reductase (H+-translocating)
MESTPATSRLSLAPGGRPRIVIVGGGFAGAYAAQALERRLSARDASVLLLDRNNYFIFYPLLVEAGTGSVHPRDAVVPIRSFLGNTDFRMGDVQQVDLARREIRYTLPEQQGTETVPFDHLVLAVGAVTRLPDLPGLAEFGFEMKSVGDAVALRDRAIRLLEVADAIEDPARRRALLRFVVVGANFTGVEVAGEFFALLREAAARYRNIRQDECSVSLIELTDRVLAALDDQDLSDYATEQMEDRGIDVRLKTSIREIRRNEVLLDDGEWLPASTVIWCAGVAPNPVLDRIPGLTRDAHGYVRTLADLRVPGCPNVWAIGDSAAVVDPHGKPYSQTAQNALQEGLRLADNVARVLHGKPTQPFAYTGRGSLAALGCRTAVAKVFGIQLSGFPAWFLWRTVYLAKMPGFSRKVRIALDWTIQLLFRRDFVQLGVHAPGSRRGAGQDEHGSAGPQAKSA